MSARTCRMRGATRVASRFSSPAAIALTIAAMTVSAASFAADDAKALKGNEVFQKWCAPCHASGPGYPGTIALAALYRGARPAALEERTDLTPDFVKKYVRTGVSVMPFFRKTEISDSDLDALAAYLTRAR